MQMVDLHAQFSAYENEIRAEMDKVLTSAAFINGPAVEELETALSVYCGAKQVAACASGTDALLLGLMAKDVQPGDEIIVPAFTYIATASMVSLCRARPVFVDVDPVTFNIDPQQILKALTPHSRGGIPVSLFGQCADMDAVLQVKLRHFREEVAMRQAAAEYYSRMLSELVKIPSVVDDSTSTWAQYTIRVPKRDEIRKYLTDAGIPSAVHYPLPLGKQKAFTHSGPQMETPAADDLASSVLSLPIHAFISRNNQSEVVKHLKAALSA